MSRYPPFLAALAAIYILEPLLTRVYICNACTAGEKARLLISSIGCMPRPFADGMCKGAMSWNLRGAGILSRELSETVLASLYLCRVAIIPVIGGHAVSWSLTGACVRAGAAPDAAGALPRAAHGAHRVL